MFRDNLAAARSRWCAVSQSSQTVSRGPSRASLYIYARRQGRIAFGWAAIACAVTLGWARLGLNESMSSWLMQVSWIVPLLAYAVVRVATLSRLLAKKYAGYSTTGDVLSDLVRLDSQRSDGGIGMRIRRLELPSLALPICGILSMALLTIAALYQVPWKSLNVSDAPISVACSALGFGLMLLFPAAQAIAHAFHLQRELDYGETRIAHSRGLAAAVGTLIWTPAVYGLVTGLRWHTALMPLAVASIPVALLLVPVAFRWATRTAVSERALLERVSPNSLAQFI